MSQMAGEGISTPQLHDAISSERALHAGNITTSTYSPYLGAILAGDHSNSYFGMSDAQMYYADRMLATMQKGHQISEVPREAAVKHDLDSDYRRQQYGVVPKFNMEFTASLKKQLWMQNVQRQRQKEFIASGGSNKTGISPYVWARMNDTPPTPYGASVPPGGGDNASQVVGPLTQIPFIQDVLGFPNPEYYLNELTTKVALPQLHAEQPETDWGTPNLQLEATQFVENRRPDFDSHFFLAKRNEFAFFIPREYRYRSTIDPYNIYVRQASDGLRQAREALTLLALSRLPDITASGGLIPVQSEILNPKTNTSPGGFPAAANNSKEDYEKLFSLYWKATRQMVDSVVMNPVDFVLYESNFYTNGWQGYQDVSDWGIIQFPGFKRRIRTVISPFAPQGKVYMFNSRFVFTGEGPMVTETWAKPEANSDAGAYRDYVDITIFNTLRAGMKGTIDGATTTPEITTLEEARALIVPPARLLEKNR